MTRRFSILFSWVGIAYVTYLFFSLMLQSLPAFEDSGSGLLKAEFWNFRKHLFGAASMVYGTVVVAAIALLIAFPLGLGAAIFVSEYLTGKLRAFAKVCIELLAGIPSIIYGLLGVLYLRDVLYPIFAPLGAVSGDSLLTAGILLAFMIFPTMMSFSDDALRCVPRIYRECARGLGLNKVETIVHVVLPASRSGIMAATLLSLGRAVGETIAVYLVIGRADQRLKNVLSWDSLLKAGQTITTKLGGSEISIAYGDPEHWGALMALGLSLWVFVGLLSHGSQHFFDRARNDW